MLVSKRLLAGALAGGLWACSDDPAASEATSLTPEGAGAAAGNSAARVGASSEVNRHDAAGTSAERAEDRGDPALEAGNGAPGGSMSSGPQPSDAPPAGALEGRGSLPDLVLDEAYLLDTTRFDVQRIDDPCAVQHGCATGLGDRRVVRFGSRMGNIGAVDFVLGAPEQGHPPWTQDACSARFSVAGFARYELRDAAGELVLVGTKNASCMTDSEEWIPESGAQCHAYTCQRQGIRPGCADNYGTDLPCQWLDVTDVPPGEYELRVTVNALHDIPEQDYSNDSVRLRLRIGADGGSLLP